MLWRRRKPEWLIDPSKVTFGSVVEDSRANLSRSHVKVRYRGDAEAYFIPLEIFVRSCSEVIQQGRSLRIDHLLVAPILRQRHPRFFDCLTDWGPAIRRAQRPRQTTQEQELRDS